MKILTIIIICLILVSCSFIFCNSNNEEGGNMEEENKYQGPVRPTDDEEHFRKTGETKPMRIKE